MELRFPKTRFTFFEGYVVMFFFLNLIFCDHEIYGIESNLMRFYCI